MPGDISQVNPVAIASDWLESDTGRLAELFVQNAPPSGETGIRVLGVVRPPYPMIRVVKTPGGSLNDLRWRISPEILIEVWGDTDGWPGPAALGDIALAAALRIKALEDRDYAPWEPVVTHADVADPYPLDDPTGQARWLMPCTLTCHPALAPELMPPREQIQGA